MRIIIDVNGAGNSNVRHEADVSEEGDLAEEISEALRQYRLQYPGQSLLDATTIKVSH